MFVLSLMFAFFAAFSREHVSAGSRMSDRLSARVSEGRRVLGSRNPPHTSWNFTDILVFLPSFLSFLTPVHTDPSSVFTGGIGPGVLPKSPSLGADLQQITPLRCTWITDCWPESLQSFSWLLKSSSGCRSGSVYWWTENTSITYLWWKGKNIYIFLFEN